MGAQGVTGARGQQGVRGVSATDSALVTWNECAWQNLNAGIDYGELAVSCIAIAPPSPPYSPLFFISSIPSFFPPFFASFILRFLLFHSLFNSSLLCFVHPLLLSLFSSFPYLTSLFLPPFPSLFPHFFFLFPPFPCLHIPNFVSLSSSSTPRIVP